MKRSACGPKADFADLFGCTYFVRPFYWVRSVRSGQAGSLRQGQGSDCEDDGDLLFCLLVPAGILDKHSTDAAFYIKSTHCFIDMEY